MQYQYGWRTSERTSSIVSFVPIVLQKDFWHSRQQHWFKIRYLRAQLIQKHIPPDSKIAQICSPGIADRLLQQYLPLPDSCTAAKASFDQLVGTREHPAAFRAVPRLDDP
jgi:hypothetical protein